MALKDKLHKIAALGKEWDSLQPIAEENNRLLWQKFTLEWNYNSNHIEGNTLTLGETKLLLLFDKTTGDHELREYEEMKSHNVAIKVVKEWAADSSRELSEADIRSLNEIILVRPYWKEAFTPDRQPTRRLIKVGEYKEQPNSVLLKSGDFFHYASPEETPRLMQELLDWYRNNNNETPVILAAELHYRFIRIHPFDDGNGRIARLLVNYVLMQHGFPPIIVKSADKENYLTALQKADAGNRAAFHEYMAEQLIWSLEIAIKAGMGEDIEEEGDLDKRINLIERQISVKNESIKNDKVLFSLWNDCLYFLTRTYLRRYHVFEKLFNESKTTAYIQIGGEGSHVDLGHLNNWFNDKKSPREKVLQIEVSYFFNDLKKNHISLKNQLKIIFEKIQYEIHIDDYVIKRKYYQILSEPEIKEFINVSANIFFTRVENSMKED